MPSGAAVAAFHLAGAVVFICIASSFVYFVRSVRKRQAACAEKRRSFLSARMTQVLDIAPPKPTHSTHSISLHTSFTKDMSPLSSTSPMRIAYQCRGDTGSVCSNGNLKPGERSDRAPSPTSFSSCTPSPICEPAPIVPYVPSSRAPSPSRTPSTRRAPSTRTRRTNSSVTGRTPSPSPSSVSSSSPVTPVSLYGSGSISTMPSSIMSQGGSAYHMYPADRKDPVPDQEHTDIRAPLVPSPMSASWASIDLRVPPPSYSMVEHSPLSLNPQFSMV